MKSNTTTGCSIAAIAVALLVAAGILLVTTCYRRARVNTAQTIERALANAIEETTALAAQAAESTPDGALVIIGKTRPEVVPFKAGEPLTREQFITFMQDRGTTDLARSAFRKAAEGTTVRWLVRTVDIREQGESISGQFTIPWEARDEHSTTQSSTKLHASFAPANSEQLLTIRRGDWLTIEGSLKIVGNDTRIMDACVVSER